MNLLEQLNPEQQRAVLTTEGPVLILAGAGSGKTRVLVHRVANLMANGVAPYHIMAITFTNKAAGEMRERINNLIGTGAEQIWVATFHSSCVRILRRYGDRIGYGTNFSIYDTDDTKTVMKEVLKKLNIDTKKFKERYFLNAISSAKNEMITAEEYALNAGSDLAKSRIAGVYREYQARMRANNAMDFDDLLVECVNLLKQDPEVLNYYQTKFEYIMVDEYQDTNTVQFELVRLLAGGRQNLCVVGDDDQSIYKFRGANIYNILNFEQQFPDATVIKLEQNYRSTKFILDTANGVIRNNEGRKDKALWTENEQGEK
ncbi:MAG: UvrD-helicase domain-containing protein, partial [Lachnospiraceae bacterium]|nr:UvrD-helicase domain-containing protein [Lachnospiraceae bacterium]